MNAEFLYVVSLCCRKLIGHGSARRPNTRLSRASSTTAPSTATIKAVQFQPTTSGWPVNSEYPHPPRNAPMMPTIMLPIQPCREFLPVRILATQPASAPKMIHEIQLRLETISIFVCSFVHVYCSYAAAEGNRDVATGDYITAEVKSFS